MFSERLKRLREGKQISQAELGKILSTTQQTINHYENDKREPDYETLKRIARVFHVSTDFLLGLTDTLVERVSGDEPIYMVKDERLPDGFMRIKMRQDWKDKDLTPEKVERIIAQALAYSAIVDEADQKNK